MDGSAHLHGGGLEGETKRQRCPHPEGAVMTNRSGARREGPLTIRRTVGELSIYHTQIYFSALQLDVGWLQGRDTLYL